MRKRIRPAAMVLAAVFLSLMTLATVGSAPASAHVCPHGDAHTVPHTSDGDTLGRCLDASYASESMGTTLSDNVQGAVTIFIFVVGVGISIMFLTVGIRRVVSRIMAIVRG